MKILGNRVLVSRIDEPKKEGFETVEVQDSFVYKGRIEQIGELILDAKSVMRMLAPEDYKQHPFEEGDTIYFAKYTPDTQEIEHEGKKLKIVKIEDILAVL